MASMVTRLTGKYDRRPIPRANLAYFLWKFIANAPRTYRALTRRTYPETRELGRELSEQGVLVGPSERFITDEGSARLVEVTASLMDATRREDVRQAVAGAASEVNRKKVFRVDLVSDGDRLPADSPLLKLALDPKLLEIVASYLGMWPRLHAVAAWLNYPTSTPAEKSQLWHRDPGDVKLLKVFIYLDEVKAECGPFTFIPRTQPFGAHALKLVTMKRVTDELMTKTFPAETWRVCTGPAHTMILADTIGYHRGGKPTDGERVLVTFTYTSGTPALDRRLRLKGIPSWLTASQRLAMEPVVTGK